jgi:hypothetical protein
VPGLLPVRFSGPLAEPAVRLVLACDSRRPSGSSTPAIYSRSAAVSVSVPNTRTTKSSAYAEFGVGPHTRTDAATPARPSNHLIQRPGMYGPSTPPAPARRQAFPQVSSHFRTLDSTLGCGTQVVESTDSAATSFHSQRLLRAETPSRQSIKDPSPAAPPHYPIPPTSPPPIAYTTKQLARFRALLISTKHIPELDEVSAQRIGLRGVGGDPLRDLSPLLVPGGAALGRRQEPGAPQWARLPERTGEHRGCRGPTRGCR